MNRDYRHDENHAPSRKHRARREDPPDDRRRGRWAELPGPATAGQPGLTEPVQVLPRDAIPAIDNPLFESVAEADRHLSDNELMIGLAGETEQRAYSTWQLDAHEIVNDVFEGRPLAVTW